MALTVCLAGIVVSVAVGWRLKLNTGVIAMVFAFVIGYFFLDMSVDDVIGYWPVNIVFYLISIALLFNYATLNGTMEVLGRKMLALLGGRTPVIPWAIALVCAVVGGLGAGASTPAIIGPFAFSMALSSGIDPVLTAVCIAFGNLIGSNNPYNGYGGVISKNLMMENGARAGDACLMGNYIWINCTIMSIFVILLFYLYFKGYRRGTGCPASAPAFTPVQQRTVAVVGISFAFMVVPEIMQAYFHGMFWKTMAGICRPQAVMAAAALACSVMRLAPEKEVIRQIPIHTIVMIAGVYMLIKVSVNAGLVDGISLLLSENIPGVMVPGVLVMLAAFLSFFSSSTSTVMPLMYPLVPHLAEGLGLNPIMLYTCIFFGGLATAVSPFSTGGALTIAGCPDPVVKEELAKRMIFCALVIPVLTFAAAQMGLFSLFGVLL